tara:strand:- start:1568 stop:1942 length:375 start_codon:yes stop_codon:yes gene_type:complete
MSKKSKYNRRRAIECKIVEKSKSNPCYCKYMITVAELDGTITKHPAYGKDMQNALARLMNEERTRWFERKLTSGWALVMWVIVMGGPIIIGDLNNPWPLVYAYAAIGAAAGSGYWWNKYITRGK